MFRKQAMARVVASVLASAVTGTLLLTATVFTTAAKAGQPVTESSQRPVQDYTVFVDPPTGFVFVKLPQGWKFAGRVSAADLAKLPAGVVTALLKDEYQPAQWAQAPAARAAR